MNSSGIKRGLAATAVAALAVTGLPLFASSASAETGDVIEVGSVGPTRNGGSVGGVVVLKTKNITEAEAEGDPAGAVPALKLANTALNAGPNASNQTVAIKGLPVFAGSGTAGDSNKTDGFDEVTLRVTVTTPSAGQTANYAIYLDDNDSDTVQAGEQRVQVAQSTSGAVTSAAITPATQTAPAGVDSGNYTLTLKDSAGRVTQLTGLENMDIVSNDPDGGGAAVAATISNAQIDATEALLGTATFTANGASPALYTITAAGDVDTDGIGADVADGPAGVSASAQLDVVAAAGALTQQEIDIVTGADSRDGFGLASNTVSIRPDQTAVTVNIKSPGNAGTTVSLTANSADVKFGGQTSVTKTVTLNAQGLGSVTFNVDASTIADTDQFTIADPSATLMTATYAAPAVTAGTVTTDASTYLSSFGGTVNPTITVKDQYGSPVTGVFVTVNRANGANDADAESARTAVDAQGKVTFALTDTSTTTPKAKDDLMVTVYPGQFGAAIVVATDKADIVYSQDGTGADFTFTVDSQLPAGSAYDPNNVFVNPLTDTVADNDIVAPAPIGDSADETIALAISGGTAGAPVSVSVDNGALLLKGTETLLSEGSATDTTTIGGPAFKIIGTKAGLVNVTVTSGGRTHTAQVSVHTLSEGAVPAVNSEDTARNVEVSGPAKAEAGDVVNFTVTVTDAFGNPVFGVPSSALKTLVSGAGQVIGDSGTTNAAGEMTVQVKIADSADSAVGLQVTGVGFDFGAAADRLTAASTTDDGKGLTKSENVATATIADVVNIAELQAAVDAAQAKVDNAQDALDAAKGDLAVAKAERAVARSEVRHAKKELRQAKRHHKGVKAARKALRQARGDLRIANAKVSAEQATVNRAMERLAAAQAELEAAQAELEAAQS